MTRALQESFVSASITMLTDLESALAAAGEGPAIILVMGTGSASFGRNAEGEITPRGKDTGLPSVIKEAHMILAGVRLRPRCVSA